MTKFCGNSIFQIFHKNPLNAPVSAFWNKNIPNFVLFLTSNRFGNFGLFNVDLSGIGTDYRKEITLSIVFYWGFSQNKLCYWNNFFWNTFFISTSPNNKDNKKRDKYFFFCSLSLIEDQSLSFWFISRWEIFFFF